ncbi:3-isopropylmalate dehydrogenase [Patescibacteria group bacterium]|nr:3-isopropylmalate dehydrogenase [Patescibacteria group bacterium]
MKKTIAVLGGDGAGPEITEQGVKVLNKVAKKFGHTFIFKEGLVGANAYDKVGDSFPKETFDLCVKADAILFGSVGDPKYDNTPKDPLKGLLQMRKQLGLYANIRPIYAFEAASKKSPLRPEVTKGTDFVVVRELIGGIYFGKKGRNKDRTSAYDTMEYSTAEIERIVHFAYKLAQKRRNKLTMVDKSNVLETSRLWREVTMRIAREYSDVETDYLLVDNAAMQILKRPATFDVIVTENTFGDILTDEASVITGSLGMLPSASIGEKTSLYEPIAGSFPRAAGKNYANPTGSILSAAMLLDYSFGLKEESKAIFKAVERVLEHGYGTKDIATDKVLGTREFGDRVAGEIVS